MDMEKILSSLLNIKALVEQSQKRYEVLLQTFQDMKNNFEEFKNNSNKEFNHLEDLLCALREEEELGALQKGLAKEADPNEISRSPVLINPFENLVINSQFKRDATICLENIPNKWPRLVWHPPWPKCTMFPLNLHPPTNPSRAKRIVYKESVQPSRTDFFPSPPRKHVLVWAEIFGPKEEPAQPRPYSECEGDHLLPSHYQDQENHLTLAHFVISSLDLLSTLLPHQLVCDFLPHTTKSFPNPPISQLQGFVDTCRSTTWHISSSQALIRKNNINFDGWISISVEDLTGFNKLDGSHASDSQAVSLNTQTLVSFPNTNLVHMAFDCLKCDKLRGEGRGNELVVDAGANVGTASFATSEAVTNLLHIGKKFFASLMFDILLLRDIEIYGGGNSGPLRGVSRYSSVEHIDIHLLDEKITWQWLLFTYSSQKGSLLLHHWVRVVNVKELSVARKVFEEMLIRDLLSWSVWITELTYVVGTLWWLVISINIPLLVETDCVISATIFSVLASWATHPPPKEFKFVGLLSVATTRVNVPPSLVLELLQRIACVMKDYFGIINEDSLQKNLVLYTGTFVTKDGKEKKVTIDFEPFRHINVPLYLCNQIWLCLPGQSNAIFLQLAEGANMFGSTSVSGVEIQMSGNHERARVDVAREMFDKMLSLGMGYAATPTNEVIFVKHEVAVGIKKILIFDPGGGTMVGKDTAPCGQGASMGDGLSHVCNRDRKDQSHSRLGLSNKSLVVEFICISLVDC